MLGPHAGMRRATQLLLCAGSTKAARSRIPRYGACLASRKVSTVPVRNDVWAAATKTTALNDTPPVMLVQRMSSVPVPLAVMVASGGTNNNGAPDLLRLTLLDPSIINLEAPFLEDGDAPDGIGVEDIILSSSVRDAYLSKKPLVADCKAQDISDPSYRPWVTVCGTPTREMVEVRAQINDREYSVDAIHLISGSPITRVSVVHSEDTIKDAIRWVWGRGHVPRHDIKATFADGTAATLNGESLLFVNDAPIKTASSFSSSPRTVSGPTRTFKFAHNSFVPGAVHLVIDGVQVQIYVNMNDAISSEDRALDQAFLYWKLGFLFLLVTAGWWAMLFVHPF